MPGYMPDSKNPRTNLRAIEYKLVRLRGDAKFVLTHPVIDCNSSQIRETSDERCMLQLGSGSGYWADHSNSPSNHEEWNPARGPEFFESYIARHLK